MTHSRTRYHHALRRLETLEPRTLLSATITSYVIPPVSPNFEAYDSSGNLWVLDINDAVSGYALDKIGVVGGNHVVTQRIPLTDASPFALTAGPNGMLYVDDAFRSGAVAGGIQVVDTVHGTVTPYLFATTQTDMPIALAVSGDGAVWFVGTNITSSSVGPGGNVIEHHTSTIGRFDPTNGSVTEFTTNATFDDSTAFTLAASGSDSVWVAFDGAIDQDITQPTGFTIGTSHIVAASFSGGSIHVDATYALNTGDANADRYGFITSIVDGGGGTVWFSLSNANLGLAPASAPDQIVEGVVSGSNLVQTPHIVPGADASTYLGVSGLTFDADSNLWFTEGGSTQFGNLGPSGFEMHDNPTTDQLLPNVASNLDGTQLSLLTIGDDFTSGYPIIQVDLPVTTVTFSGSANTLSAREDTAITSTLLATFVAPTPSTGYTATISWGDSTTSVITPTSLGDNTYAIVIPSKTFATQGTFNGVITIKDGTATTGTLTFQSLISDIPLNVTSLTVSPLLLRIVTAVGTFTDDSDLALSTWTATINWGDSTTSTGVIVRDPTQSGRYLVLGLHQYHTRGTYTVRLTVSTTEALDAVTRNTLTTTVTAR